MVHGEINQDEAIARMFDNLNKIYKLTGDDAYDVRAYEE
jgi:hypothetical protein